MNTLQIREARAVFSALIADAEHGKPTLITRRGLPPAMVVPLEAGRRLYPIDTPSLASYLLSMPDALPAVDRDTTPRRDAPL